MLVLTASVALAQEPAPPPAADPAWEDRAENGRRLYEGGMITGLLGVGGIVVGTTAAVSVLITDSSDNEAALGLSVATALLGVIAIEVGAPIALVGARQEHTALKRLGRAPGGTTACDVGWGFYIGQIVFPPAFLGGYVGAAVQHADNGMPPGTAMIPAAGVRGRF